MIISKNGRRLLDSGEKTERREKRSASAEAAMSEHREHEAHKRGPRSEHRKMNDQQRLMEAVREAQPILARYIEPGSRDATQTVINLLAVLDRGDVVEAMERLEFKNGLRLS